MSLPWKLSAQGGRVTSSTDGGELRATNRNGASSPQGQMTSSIGSRGGLSAGVSQPHWQDARSAQQQHGPDSAEVMLESPGLAARTLATRGISEAAESCQETQARMARVRSMTPVYPPGRLAAKQGAGKGSESKGETDQGTRGKATLIARVGPPGLVRPYGDAGADAGAGGSSAGNVRAMALRYCHCSSIRRRMVSRSTCEPR